MFTAVCLSPQLHGLHAGRHLGCALAAGAADGDAVSPLRGTYQLTSALLQTRASNRVQRGVHGLRTWHAHCRWTPMHLIRTCILQHVILPKTCSKGYSKYCTCALQVGLRISFLHSFPQ